MEENEEVLDFVAFKAQKEQLEYLKENANEEYYKDLRYVYDTDRRANRDLKNMLYKTKKQLKIDCKVGTGLALASAASVGVAIGGIFATIQNFGMGMAFFGVTCAVGAVICAGISAVCAFCSAKRFKKALKEKARVEKLNGEIENVAGDLKDVEQELKAVAEYLGKEY